MIQAVDWNKYKSNADFDSKVEVLDCTTETGRNEQMSFCWAILRLSSRMGRMFGSERSRGNGASFLISKERRKPDCFKLLATSLRITLSCCYCFSATATPPFYFQLVQTTSLRCRWPRRNNPWVASSLVRKTESSWRKLQLSFHVSTTTTLTCPSCADTATLASYLKSCKWRRSLVCYFCLVLCWSRTEWWNSTSALVASFQVLRLSNRKAMYSVIHYSAQTLLLRNLRLHSTSGCSSIGSTAAINVPIYTVICS